MTSQSWEEKKEEYMLFWDLDCQTRLDKIWEILDYFIAGETSNKRLLFFLFLGDYHPKFMSTKLFRGDSSAGKNHVVENTLKLFPKKDTYIFDSATAQALRYDQDLLGKKHLYLREMKEGQEVVEFLKMFHDGQMIHKETVKDPDSGGQTVITHTFDRLGIITTFSFESVQIDIVNRSWVLNPDQTHDQTRNITEFTINQEVNLIEHKKKTMEMNDKAFYISQAITLLEMDYMPFIAYAKLLETLFPVEHLNVRRDISKLFQLIKIVCIFNQKQRKIVDIEGEKFLFAEYEDLKIALEIAQDLFINTVLHLDTTKREILDFIKDYVDPTAVMSIEDFTIEEPTQVPVTPIHEFLRTRTSISRKTVIRRLNDLFYEGYLLREKVSNKYVYSILKDYDLVSALNLNEIKEQVDELVEEAYEKYVLLEVKELSEGYLSESREG